MPAFPTQSIQARCPAGNLSLRCLAFVFTDGRFGLVIPEELRRMVDARLSASGYDFPEVPGCQFSWQMTRLYLVGPTLDAARRAMHELAMQQLHGTTRFEKVVLVRHSARANFAIGSGEVFPSVAAAEAVHVKSDWWKPKANHGSVSDGAGETYSVGFAAVVAIRVTTSRESGETVTYRKCKTASHLDSPEEREIPTLGPDDAILNGFLGIDWWLERGNREFAVLPHSPELVRKCTELMLSVCRLAAILDEIHANHERLLKSLSAGQIQIGPPGPDSEA